MINERRYGASKGKKEKTVNTRSPEGLSCYLRPVSKAKPGTVLTTFTSLAVSTFQAPKVSGTLPNAAV